MKKYILFLVLCMVNSRGQNIIQNPGFEYWSGGQPIYWQKDDSILLYQENTTVHSGNFSVKDSLITQTQTKADLFQGYIEVQPNIQYNFHIWVWDDDPAGRLRPGVEWFPSGTYWSGNYSVDSSAWQELSFTVISPSDAESVLVLIRAYDVASNWDGGAVFYLDDVYFAPLATQPPLIIRVWHHPINPAPNTTEDIYAWVTDDGTIIADTLFYGVNNLSNLIKCTHYTIHNDTFRFHIPCGEEGDTVFYYLKFYDDDGLEVSSDTHSYFVGITGISINEVYYDTPGPDSGCFIELYAEPGTGLDGMSIKGINGNGGNEYVEIDLSGHSIPQDGFFVIADCGTVPNADLIDPGVDLQNGPDNVQLCLNGIVIDALGYGELDGWVFVGEWCPGQDVSEGHSLGRYPDGSDTDNNAVDFNDYVAVTPGESNPAVGIELDSRSKPSVHIMNPVRSDARFCSIIKEKDHYPLEIFNILGQRVKLVFHPMEPIGLSTGAYIIRSDNEKGFGLKFIVLR
ncbi:hypothetical protein BXT86_02080 [candidate division WOR-3 bacterium 4484_100]|uniref:CBM-cenC domain-containing protein n=1 Tax=candidate division WOR-3 bacterium 4484_100 TaxID=1936077 RepID=A0A1V4QFW4_UNCW3|nr:MAG: hypothetical protein BXT86_02080 [candidate division WOR-3 bacterium 4484_100]